MRTCLLLLTLLVVTSGRADAQPPRAGSVRGARFVERAERFLASGDLGSATSLFRRAIQADPAGSAGYLGLARVYVQRGVLVEARAVLEAGVRRVPRSLALELALVDLLVAQGDLESAALRLEEIVRARPRRADAWRRHGEVARRRGRFSVALGAYRVVVDLAARGEQVVPDDLEEARRFVAALELLLRDRDPVARCDGSSVRTALCGG
ncbi:MAG: tetratricopeptide repeat protein [Myxococcota bacterium]